MREYVRVKCNACEKEVGFAVNPHHIPVMFCIKCKIDEEHADREYEHPDD